MRPTRARIPHRLYLLLAATVLAIASTSPATADDFAIGPPDAGWLADSAIHSFCFTATFDLKNAARYAMNNVLDAQTDMSDLEQVCSTGQTDVVWIQADLDPGTRGETLCVNWPGSYPPDPCLSYEVTLDKAEIDLGSNDNEDRKKTACHEVGHTAGLIHNNTDCMISGEIPNLDPQWQEFAPHHIWHINSAY